MTQMTKSLVTGGTGFIALYVVKILLENGHHVNTTVRNLKNLAKCKPLLDLQAQYPSKLVLYEADLMSSGSFGAAMEGCEIVYHIASPFLVPQQIKDGMKECVTPALQGTENVLESVNKTESVRRVVLTSSIAAMYGDSAELCTKSGNTLTEDYWNETSSVTYNPYSYSKLVAEQKAWKMYKAQNRWDLVVINPGLVLGPPLTTQSASGSLYMLEGMYHGEYRMGSPELHYPIADVRDVATAHVRAGEMPVSKGRYIIASDHSLSLLEMANFIRPIHQQPKLLPNRNLPKLMVYLAGPFIGLSKKWVAGNIGFSFKVDNSRAIRDFGIKYRPVDETVRDHYYSWLARGA